MMKAERAAERAADWIWEGYYDELIKEKIRDGDFDETVLERAKKLLSQTSFKWTHQEYDQIEVDDCHG